MRMSPKIAFPIIFSVLYLLQAALDGSSTLAVNMHQEGDQRLSAEIFYTADGNYSSANSSSGYIAPGSPIVLFQLPDLDSISHIRLDPIKESGTVYIEEFVLYERSLFRLNKYRIPLDAAYPLADISHFVTAQDQIILTSSGRDPNIELPLELRLEDTSFRYHPASALVALLCTYIVMLAAGSRGAKEKPADFLAKVAIYIVFTGFALLKIGYYQENVDYGHPPDETRHVDYAEYLDIYDRVVPDFDDMYLPYQEGQINAAHPPLYYHYLLTFAESITPRPATWTAYRAASVPLAVLTFFLLAFLCFREQLSLLAHFTYLSLVSSVPMLAYLGASINNDTLAILGGTVFALGLVDFIKRPYSTKAVLLILAGSLLAYFGKLTAALLIFAALGFLTVYLYYKKIPFQLSPGHFILAAFFIAPVIGYQVHIISEYGSILPPALSDKDPAGFQHSDFFKYGVSEDRLSIGQWWERQLMYINQGWFGIHAHKSLYKTSLTGIAGLLILHVFALLAVFLRPKPRLALHTAGVIGLLSIIVVMVLQFFKGYQYHLEIGYMGGLQPRYQLPFIFSIGALAAVFVDRLPGKVAVTAAVITVSLAAIYSDFFYFLQNY